MMVVKTHLDIGILEADIHVCGVLINEAIMHKYMAFNSDYVPVVLIYYNDRIDTEICYCHQDCEKLIMCDDRRDKLYYLVKKSDVERIFEASFQ